MENHNHSPTNPLSGVKTCWLGWFGIQPGSKSWAATKIRPERSTLVFVRRHSDSPNPALGGGGKTSQHPASVEWGQNVARNPRGSHKVVLHSVNFSHLPKRVHKKRHLCPEGVFHSFYHGKRPEKLTINRHPGVMQREKKKKKKKSMELFMRFIPPSW